MLCNHSTEKLLGLKGVIVKNVRQLLHRIEIVVELPRKPHICPCCGKRFFEENPFLPRYYRIPILGVPQLLT